MKKDYIGITRTLAVVGEATANIDAKYGPYESVSEVLNNVPISLREIGLTVGIIKSNGVSEYWWKEDINDSDLILKIDDAAITKVSELENDAGFVSQAQVNTTVHIERDRALLAEASLQNSKADLSYVNSITSDFKGYFTTIESLTSAYPPSNNLAGWYAWVGNPYPGTVYNVSTVGGNWTNTGQIPNEEPIDLSDYAKRTEANVSLLEEVTANYNLFRSINFVAGKMISSVDGSVVNNANLWLSEYIAVQPGKTYAVYLGNMAGISNAGGAFDENQNFIIGLGAVVSGQTTFVTVPDNCYFVRMHVTITIYPKGWMVDSIKFSKNVSVKDVFDAINDYDAKNLYDYSTSVYGQYLNNSGGITSSSQLAISDFIEVEEYEDYIVRGGGVDEISITAAGGFFDANKDWISAIPFNNSGLLMVSTPKNCKYLRFNMLVDYMTKAFCSKKSYTAIKTKEITDIVLGDNILDVVETYNQQLWVMNSDGVISLISSIQHKATDFIPVNKDNIYRVFVTIYDNQAGSGFWFDANKEYLSNVGAIGKGITYIRPPEGAAFVKLNVPRYAQYVRLVDSTNYLIDIQPTQIRGFETKNEASTIDLLNDVTWDQGYVRAVDGSVMNSATFSHTNPILLNSSIKAILVYFGYTSTGCFYDENMNWISSMVGPDEGGLDLWFDVPNNAKYVIINAQNSMISVMTAYADITENTKGTLDWLLVDNYISKTNHWYGKKIVWLGTSIPYNNGNSWAYPHQIANKLDCIVDNTSLNSQAVHLSATGGIVGLGSTAMTLDEYAAIGVSDPGNRCYENSLMGKDADLYVFDTEPNNTNVSTEDFDLFNFNTWQYSDGSDIKDHRKTYLGAIIFLLTQLFNEKPNARVVFVTETDSRISTTVPSGLNDNTALISDKLRIPWIDLRNTLQYHHYSIPIIIADRLHPREEGSNYIADVLANRLLQIR